jgi:Protein of unknown function (DUF3088)
MKMATVFSPHRITFNEGIAAETIAVIAPTNSFNIKIMAKLFLLKSDFTDSNSDSQGLKYYCPHCATVEGVLSYFPQLREQLEIEYVDFNRPRPQVVALLGEENQSCPVIVLEQNESKTDTSYFSSYNGKLFVNSTKLILRFLAENYGISFSH